MALIRRRPDAARDVVEQALHIAADDRAAAERFAEAVERTLALLAGMPRIGAKRSVRSPSLRGLRMLPVRGFDKHLIFYRPIRGGIEVVRILHAARDIAAILHEEAGRDE